MLITETAKNKLLLKIIVKRIKMLEIEIARELSNVTSFCFAESLEQRNGTVKAEWRIKLGNFTADCKQC